VTAVTAPVPAGRDLLVRSGPIALRVDRRALGVGAGLVVVVTVGLVVAVASGEVAIPLRSVAAEVLGGGADGPDAFVIRTLRLPRALTGALVGAALGLAGAIFQRLLANPLASPDLLGVSAGAAVGAVLALVVAGVGSTLVVTSAALAGAVVAVVAITLLAVRDGLTGFRLILVGVGLTAVLDAVVVLLLRRAELRDAARATTWLTGSLNGRGWEYVRPLTLALLLLVPLALVGARCLRTLELGDDAAAALGVPVARCRAGLALVGAALAAVATAAAGPVGFVALAAPQVARGLVGPRGGGLLPAALVGAAIVVWADVVGRLVLAPVELPVGVVTAVVGAPYLLWLLVRANRAGWSG